jgi:glycosyltransferase involved in cell wall biosynthesis
MYRQARPRPKELELRAGPVLLFPAVFHYQPNQLAADFLIREVFPKFVARRPDASLALAGSDPTPAMLASTQTEPRIIVTGRVPDMVPYLQHSSVMLAPLSDGGGTRFKIIEAFAANLPVASSAKGAEGLGAEPGKHFLLAEKPDEFVQVIEMVLDQPDLRERMVRSAADLAGGLFVGARAAIRKALPELRN